MQGNPATDEPIVIGNEFSEVHVTKVRTRNGMRLRIRDAKSDREILLCPLALESLTWQNPDLFTELLSTPYGPEDE
ncbi:dihydrodiol dehydrogenase [Streptomyces sp. NPDC006872]|uniref:dihydrodiol dehydrogenase n=1 Tax=Streptomyces sp. NPDC006872 TaxID=3155720 RepID=UPI00340852CC